MPRTYYKKGDSNLICDRTGFKIKHSEARKEWNGLMVRKQSFEERHPQDFAAVARASQPVPDARLDQRVNAPYPAGILLDQGCEPILDSNGFYILSGVVTFSSIDQSAFLYDSSDQQILDSSGLPIASGSIADAC